MPAPIPNNRPRENFRGDSRTAGKTTAFFCLLFAGLFLLYRPAFRNPPRSDYWSAFYVFQQLESSSPPPAWKGVLTFDLWKHGTYRPLSHLVPYLQHRLFGSRFVWNHITNFAGYCLSILLLYLLAVRLSIDRTLAAIFLTVFAFLFSHCDILTWTFQLFTILGFCSFLLGFILYIDYLQSRRAILLLPVGVLFLYGMQTLEIFALWPLAIFILPFALASPPRPYLKWRDAAPLLAYIFYLGGWLLHRGTTGALPAPVAGELGTGLLLVFFNLAYNGIAVTLHPRLAQPVFFDDNMNLGGWLLSLGTRLEAVASWTGGTVILLLLVGTWWLLRKRQHRLLALLAFGFFLYLTNFFTVATSRLTTNRALYPLSQFRYQYIPNGLLALTLAAAIGALFRPRIRGKIIIGLILVPVLVFNILASHRQVALLEERLRPLAVMLDNIRQGLDGGAINRDDPLYISSGVPDRVPSPGWNRNMARFMEGNFQWFFPAREMEKFSLQAEEATWIITKDSYPEISPNPERRKNQ
ncbi:MAG: hypothetical protein P9M08_00275 [Candidatus Erginobacter occultus]|nr:hypothetical protein [Candidatus Erginobacter occultus]